MNGPDLDAPAPRRSQTGSRSARLHASADQLHARTQQQREGLLLLAAIVALMWGIEVINTLDSNRLDGDGLYARSVGRLWGILTAPFIHESFQHLFANTIPLLFLGAIIALHGARRLALVTGFVIVVGGLGTWIFGSGEEVGASSIVFGYATYLLARGFFDRSLWELAVGLLVGVVWGAVLLSSLIPHAGVSWQAHLFGGIAGVIVAWRLARRDKPRTERPLDADGRSTPP